MSAQDGPRISLCMIVRDEEAMLGACLASVEGAVDEICIVDTGSTDSTPEIARAFGARVRHVPWNERFDEARNASLDMATGDWILVLDADERLMPYNWATLRRLTREAPPQLHGCFINCCSPTPDQPDVSPVLRIFRRLSHIRYVGRVHEDIGPTIENTGAAIGLSSIDFLHLGYLGKPVEQKQKWDRNERLLLLEDEERPDQGITQYNLGHQFLIRMKVEEGRAGPDAVEINRCQERAHFYFGRALALARPEQLFWSRLVQEAQLAGHDLAAHPRYDGRLPQDPIACGLAPDPLRRVA